MKIFNLETIQKDRQWTLEDFGFTKRENGKYRREGTPFFEIDKENKSVLYDSLYFLELPTSKIEMNVLVRWMERQFRVWI